MRGTAGQQPVRTLQLQQGSALVTQTLRFSNYVQSMRPFSWNNLFNASYTVPLIHNDQPLKGYSIVNYADLKLPNDLNYLRPLSEGSTKQLRYESFSESYVLRGRFRFMQDP